MSVAEFPTVSRRAFLGSLAGWTAAARCRPARAADPDPLQRRIAESLASRCVGSKILYDPAGNVVKLALSRHTGLRDQDPSSFPPGIDDERFADILNLTKLQAVFIEKMPLSDDGYALLGQLKQLRDVRIHYPAWALTQENPSRHYRLTDRFGTCLNHLPGLRVLQLKHIFRLDGDGLAGIHPQPELEHLEIDTICAKPSAVPFISAARKLRNLQIHRCQWTDAHLQTVLAALPDLEVLELKPMKVPRDPITARSLAGLARCPKLKLLQLTGDMGDLSFSSGLDVAAQLPALRQVNLLFPKITPDSDVVKQLHAARPDLLIRVAGRSIGGAADQKPMEVDDGYDWGGSVTTHG
jgi:hypothetical protein